MSKIALSGNPSGTGTFTIASPNSNNDRTVNLPDSAGDLVVTSATQSLTNKSFNSAPVDAVTGTAPLYMCRAWVNFNGTGTVAIRAAGNVSSITDNGTGQYTLNFTTAMPDANYSVVGSFTWGNNGNQFLPLGLATNFCQVGTLASNAYADSTIVCVAIFR